MIKQDGSLFYLIAGNFSIILELCDGYLFLEHVGQTISHYHFSRRVHRMDHAFSGGPNAQDRTFSFDTQRQVLGQHGLGDFRLPSIRLQHHQNEVTDFKVIGYEITEGAAIAEGLPNPHFDSQCETVTFHLWDDVAKIALDLNYTVYPLHDVITSFVSIQNQSQEVVVIHEALSVMLDLPRKSYDVLTFQGAYGREKEVKRQAVTQGTFSISSNRGASGHAQTPSLLIMDTQTTESCGEVLALQLMYSGNFKAFVQQNQLGEVRVGVGLNDANFSWELQPNEVFDTPVAVMQYTRHGLTTLSQKSHQFIQQCILPEKFAYQQRPILINNWEATYFDFNREKLLALADEATKVGIELFVLDDGWFGQRQDDNRALGDWTVNETKLGGSLNELIEEIHAKGLKFGIWIEPEMISQDSELYRQHPDWCIHVPNRGKIYSRNQLVLDYSNPKVVDYIYSVIDTLLSMHDIDYVKWDMNRNITSIGNGKTYLETKMQSHKYMLGLYRLLSRITTRHPNVLFESCSGGGGRNDLGLMRYFSQVWASDNTDAISRLDIQYGSSYLYPTITMGSHVSAVPNHQVQRMTKLSTRGHVAMMGNLGYELDLTSLNDEEKLELANQVAHYKTIRPIIQFGTQYRLVNPTNESNESAVQFVYDNASVVTYVRKFATIEWMETTLCLKGLEEESLYREIMTDKIYSGSELMYAGITLDMPRGDYLSRQFYFIKETER